MRILAPGDRLDGAGQRLLVQDGQVPHRIDDATGAGDEGIAVCFQHFPDVEVLLEDGCHGPGRDHRGR
ncbi:hypothetical protein [Streptomyces alkaliphilus]|uniref:hypothetical protein n=1 Tax=Streptomyces alkaliphilus TaxID=1472722 RepID=UPI003F6725B1